MSGMDKAARKAWMIRLFGVGVAVVGILFAISRWSDAKTKASLPRVTAAEAVVKEPGIPTSDEENRELPKTSPAADSVEIHDDIGVERGPQHRRETLQKLSSKLREVRATVARLEAAAAVEKEFDATMGEADRLRKDVVRKISSHDEMMNLDPAALDQIEKVNAMESEASARRTQALRELEQALVSRP